MGKQRASRNTSHDVCPAEVTVAVIGGRWKLFIIWHLFQGSCRFSELHRKVTGISQKMLTQQLREMEANNLIKRTVFAEVPPRVDYEITPLGKSLNPVIAAMCDWGRKHKDEVG